MSPRPRTFTLRNAEANLRRLIEKAGKGEAVFITNRGQRFLLREVSRDDSIPVRPPGYFENCYTRAEIREDNRLAKASVIRAPEDLE